MRKIFGCGLALALVLALAGLMMAQASIVQGLVTDSTGAPVDSARVMLKKCGGCGGPGMGTGYSTYTGPDGHYIFSSVAPNSYRAAAMKMGVGRDMDTLTVVAGNDYTLNFVLIPGGCGMHPSPVDTCGGPGMGGGGCQSDSCGQGGGGCQGDTCTSGGCGGGGCGGGGCSVVVSPKINGAYPNPFNPSTTVSFVLPQSGMVNLSVWNLRGQKVAQLVSGNLEAGLHQAIWSAENLSSGIYLFRLEADNTVSVKRVVFAK